MTYHMQQASQQHPQHARPRQHVPAPVGVPPPPPPPPAPPAQQPCGDQSTTASGRVVTRDVLEGVLGFRVHDFDKYVSVFTHKSAVRDTGRQSYERYEYVGDAVINFVVAKYLYDRFPDSDEGFLTRVRTKLVSGKFLSAMSERLGLQQLVTMNRKAIQQGWYANPRIMEDVFESLVGCLYLDLGLMAARNFVIAVIERHSSFDDVLVDTNYKDALMRYAQARALPLPDYRVLNDPQVTRQPMFRVVAVLDGVAYGDGVDGSKKGAEQKAAQTTLRQLGQLGGSGRQFIT